MELRGSLLGDVTQLWCFSYDLDCLYDRKHCPEEQ